MVIAIDEKTMVKTHITITLKQQRLLKQHPELNLSGFVRKKLDEYFLSQSKDEPDIDIFEK